MSYILVHDLGTTGDKAALFDEKGRLAGWSEQQYPTQELYDGGFEQNPADWLNAVCAATKRVLAKTGVPASDIDAISLAGHMMGVVALDANNRPVRPAILHSDLRSRAQVRQIREKVASATVYNISGNPLDVHYPWAKVAWLRDSDPGAYKTTRYFVQSKDYVSAWLTGCEPVTDYSDASLYGCFDFHSMRWSEDLCQAANIDIRKLPAVVQAGTKLGRLTRDAAKGMDLPAGIPVYMGFGDGAAAALGSGSWRIGSCYNYVGSTSWVAATTASPLIDPEARLFVLALTSARFSSIGTVQCAGASWDWAVTRLCQAQFDAAEALAAASPPGAKGLLFLPYLSGERAPIWNDNARGVWFGLCNSHGAGDLLRSVLEGVSLALASIFDDVCRCSGHTPSQIRVIGGGARTKLWRQILVAAFGRPIRFPDELGQATARGAFLAAALGSGLLSSFDEGDRLMPSLKSMEPDACLTATYEAMKPLFSDLYRRLEGSFEELARLRTHLASLEVCHAAV